MRSSPHCRRGLAASSFGLAPLWPIMGVPFDLSPSVERPVNDREKIVTWLGRKKIAFVPLSRPNAHPPDLIPPD